MFNTSFFEVTFTFNNFNSTLTLAYDNTSNLSGFATKITFPKAPKGTKINIKKSSGDSCKVKGRVVQIRVTGSCELAVTLTRKGKVVGKQKLVIG